MQQAARCFAYIADALEAETLQGQTADRIIAAGKQLISAAGLDANQLLTGMSPERQQTIRTLFS